jgi:uncharacterized protein with FMN-binding domain
VRRSSPMKTSRALLAATSAGFVAVLSVHAITPSGRKAAIGPPSTTPTTSPTPTVPGSTRSAVGANEQFGYGSIAVKVTVQGTHIVAVSVANFQPLESYSQSLTDYVVPMLTSEALAAQSANIQGISGASYSSSGFAQSLQSALTQLGI